MVIGTGLAAVGRKPVAVRERPSALTPPFNLFHATAPRGA